MTTTQQEPCPSCDGTREVAEVYEKLEGKPGYYHGHTSLRAREVLDCPLCAHRCLSCRAKIWESEEAGEVPLTNYMRSQFWCDADCLRRWLDFGVGRDLNDAQAYLLLLVSKDIYQGSCGCILRDDSHSVGCHATVTELNALIEAVAPLEAV